MKKTLCLFVCLVLAFSAYGQETLKKAYSFFEKKDYEKAKTFLIKHLKSKPKDPDALNFLGLAYLYTSRPDSAVYYFSKAIDYNPKLADSYNNRGFALGLIGLADSAMGDFNTALELDTLFAKAYLNRAALYDIIGIPEKAAEDYSKAISLDSTNPEAFYRRALLKYKMNEFADAMNDFDQCEKMGLTPAELYLNRGNIFFKSNMNDRAVAEYGKAIEKDPDMFDAYNNRAILYDFLGDSSKAEADRHKMRNLGVAPPIPLDSLRFVSFMTTDSSFSIVLPYWNSFERIDTAITELLVSPENISPEFPDYITGVYCAMNRNIEARYGVKDPKELIEFWRENNNGNMLANALFTPLTEKRFHKDGLEYLKMTSQMKTTYNSPELRLIQYVVAGEDKLFFAYLQAPAIYYNYYDRIMEIAIDGIILNKK